MSAAARAPDPAVARRVSRCVVLGGTALMALVVWGERGRPRAAALLVALQVGHVLVARALHPWWSRRQTRLAGIAVTVLHTALCLTQAHVARWSLAVCFFAIYPVFATASHQDRESRSKAVSSLGAFALAATLDGVPPSTVAACALLCAVLYSIWEVRTGVLRQALAALEAERTKLDSAYRKLLEQEKLSSLGMLAAGVAHEINNPMGYIASNLQQLAEDLPLLASRPALADEYVTDVLPATLDGVRRVNAIVDDLRRFARGDAETMRDFDLNAEVAAAVRIGRSKLGPDCQIALDLGAIPPLTGRPQEIARVVLNLVVNAGQATRGPGTIRVSTRPAGDGVELAVGDSGTGMTPEVRSRLFEPFFTTKPVGEGTGLGLAVVHGVVHGHGGRIAVESEVGAGSVFTVWLPAPARARAELQRVA